MIKNLVLDMGNVLLRYDPQVALDAFCGSQEEKELIRKELFEGPEWAQGDLGVIRDMDRFDLVKQRVPQDHWNALRQCCEGWFICMKPIPGAEKFCREMKEKGYGLYVLSNASDAFYHYFPQFLPLDFFDGIVVSADIHMVKPDLKIYRYLLDHCNLIGEECLFLDDVRENVEGARAAGINAQRFLGDFEEIRKKYRL